MLLLTLGSTALSTSLRRRREGFLADEMLSQVVVVSVSVVVVLRVIRLAN